ELQHLWAAAARQKVELLRCATRVAASGHGEGTMTRTTGWLTLAITLLARQAPGQERVDEHWALDPNGAVRITCPFGKIRVRGWDAETLAVTGRLERGAGRLSATGDAHVRTIEATGP